MDPLTRTAVRATLHCLTGCAIGEVLGLILGTWWGWSTPATIALAVGLAFLFGYALTFVPVLRAGLTLRAAVTTTLAADTVSILTMEVVDNGVMLAVPGAMDAGLADPLFWGALAVAFLVAFLVTLPVNRRLIARGRGHAVVHHLHPAGHAEPAGQDRTSGTDRPDRASHAGHDAAPSSAASPGAGPDRMDR